MNIMRSFIFCLTLTSIILSYCHGVIIHNHERASKRPVEIVEDIADKFNIIDDHLQQKVESDDIEANLGEAKRLLNAAIANNKSDEVLIDALNLFISLEKVTTSDMCNEEGFQITSRNYLAARNDDIKYSDRRTDKIINHYSLISAKICRAEYPGKFINLVQQLDMLTMRSVRVLISEFRLNHSNTNLASQIQFEKEFTTPELFKWKQWIVHNGKHTIISDMRCLTGEVLIRVLGELVGSKVNDKIWLTGAEYQDLEDGAEAEVGKSKLALTYETYLEKPCEKYINTVDRFFHHLHQHWLIYYRRYVLEDYYASMEREMTKYVGVLIGRDVKTICDVILKRKSVYLEKVAKLID